MGKKITKHTLYSWHNN